MTKDGSGARAHAVEWWRQAPESTVGQPFGSLSAGNIRGIFGRIFEMPCAEWYTSPGLGWRGPYCDGNDTSFCVGVAPPMYVHVSSTLVRKRASSGQGIEDLVPPNSVDAVTQLYG
eukprot:9481269-Pyramimonas_sp.AAC.2